jgi:membrane protein involved in colicin uptake
LVKHEALETAQLWVKLHKHGYHCTKQDVSRFRFRRKNGSLHVAPPEDGDVHANAEAEYKARWEAQRAVEKAKSERRAAERAAEMAFLEQQAAAEQAKEKAAAEKAASEAAAQKAATVKKWSVNANVNVILTTTKESKRAKTTACSAGVLAPPETPL